MIYLPTQPTCALGLMSDSSHLKFRHKTVLQPILHSMPIFSVVRDHQVESPSTLRLSLQGVHI
jgi:hypothetical protein